MSHCFCQKQEEHLVSLEPCWSSLDDVSTLNRIAYQCTNVKITNNVAFISKKRNRKTGDKCIEAFPVLVSLSPIVVYLYYDSLNVTCLPISYFTFILTFIFLKKWRKKCIYSPDLQFGTYLYVRNISNIIIPHIQYIPVLQAVNHPYADVIDLLWIKPLDLNTSKNALGLNNKHHIYNRVSHMYLKAISKPCMLLWNV